MPGQLLSRRLRDERTPLSLANQRIDLVSKTFREHDMDAGIRHGVC